MKLLKYIILLSIIIVGQVYSQATSVSGNINIRIGNGSQFDSVNDKSEFIYNEILTDINIYRANLSGWMQFEYSNPPEYGRSLSTIRRFRFNYQKNNWNIDIGDIYRSWDRGLILSQFDDQQIDFDNSIRGGGLVFNSNNFDIDIIAGFRKQYQSTPFNINLRQHDESVDHKLVAGRYGLNIGEVLNSFTILVDEKDFSVKTRGNTKATISNAKNYLAGYSMELNKSTWDIVIDAVYKYTTINPELYFVETDYSDFSIDSIVRNKQTGYSFYSILNKYFGNWTFTLDYKKYHYAVMNPDRRITYPYPENSIIYQNPPLTFFEHSSTLLNRNIHQLDKSDEIGYQLSLTGLINNNINIFLNLSQGSRNIEWSRKPSEFIWQKNPWEKAKTAYLFPLTTPGADPYLELFGEATFYLLDDHLVTKIGLSHSNQDLLLFENLKSTTYDSLAYEFVNAITLPIDFSFAFSNGYSIEVKYQWQQLEKGIKTEVINSGEIEDSQTSFYYDKIEDGTVPKRFQQTSIFQIGFHKAPNWGLSFSIEKDKYQEFGINSDNIELNPLEKMWEGLGFDSNHSWISTELLWNIASKYRLSIFYGSEKGGLQCRNGVCRVIQPFSDGFRVSLMTIF